MAAYALVADIQSEFKGVTFGATSNPKDTDVTAFIAQAEARINSRVSIRYVTPVDATASPISTLILKQASIWMVAQRIKNILRVKSSDDKANQGGGEGDLEKKAVALVEDIATGILPLTDAVSTSVGGGVRSGVLDMGEVPVFMKDVTQW